MAVTHRLPWRSTPVGPAVLALSLGTLAVAAAPGLHIDRLLGLHGVGGEVATFGGAVLGANLMNNLPAVVVSLPALQEHPDRVWALLLGVNIGPTLWATGALSTLLWQSTMSRLGHPVSARRYASIGWRVGIPALLTALAVRPLPSWPPDPSACCGASPQQALGWQEALGSVSRRGRRCGCRRGRTGAWAR